MIFFPGRFKYKSHTVLMGLLIVMFCVSIVKGEKVTAQNKETIQKDEPIISAKKTSPTTIELLLEHDHKMLIDFYGENIFRVFQDNSGGKMREPEARPQAKILVPEPRRPVAILNLKDENGFITITTGKVRVEFNKKNSLMKVVNLNTNAVVIEEARPVEFDTSKTVVSLKENPGES